MTNLNGINGVSVGFNTNLPERGAQAEVKPEKEAVPQKPAQVEISFMSGDDVMSVMAQQANINTSNISGVRSYDVAKYVTPEQAKRIAGFVAGFENIVAANLASVAAEFGNSISDAAKMNIALAAAEK